MEEIRKKQVVDLLSKLNEMSLADFGEGYASFVFEDDILYIDARSRTARMALEMLLHGFLKMSVFNDGSCMLKIMFY